MKSPRLWILSVLTLVSCSPMPIEENKEQSFHLISDEELSQGMQRMAEKVSLLALFSLDSDMSTEQKRMMILPLLNNIESIASDINGDGAVTNYSVINRYMGSFLYDVSLAREFANRQPPNLFPAQRLIKSCMACHESI